MGKNIPNSKFELHIRKDNPDFLDLPWDKPLKNWDKFSDKIIHLEKGLSRHEVVFVNWEDEIFVFKNLNVRLAKKEYEILRIAEQKSLQSVIPIGWGEIDISDEIESGIIITQYLRHSLPFRSLFKDKNLERYRIRLQDAIAGLIVSLHLHGFFWGDCSLSNVLFRRDAGELQAFLVDAETSEVQKIMSSTMREYDLEIMRENITGDLLDIAVLNELPDALDVYSVGNSITEKYNQLWNEISETTTIRKSENYKIHERIRKLNQLGFTVDEIVLFPSLNSDEVQFKTIVTDQHYHQNLLHSITGLVARENQARQLINEIQEIKLNLSKIQNCNLTLGEAAYHWKNNNYFPYIDELRKYYEYLEDPIENYCQILEHKWFLSEKAKKDVGLQTAFKDYLEKKLNKEIEY